MIEQIQAQLKEAQITPVGAVNDTEPAIALGNYAQMDDPNISQTHGNHETCQTCGVCDMALAQVEATALLIFFGVNELALLFAGGLLVMAALTLQLGQASLVDLLTVVLAIVALGSLFCFKVNSDWLVMGGALVGLASALLG